uniref:Uncharacterized protein n=1 Tax=Sphaerodactylus townsendi TaxID=933632 RepID=A0ACB8G336_9SAUR
MLSYSISGIHSSTAAELFVTGALPASGTFPAASVYQHPTAYSSRNFATVPSLTLQDAAFSATSNGLLTNHDSLLQIKTSQGTIPTALTFERLGNSVLSTSMPPQSSTYRSAQESAAHLLQPQFSLLPSSLGGAQQAPQAQESSSPQSQKFLAVVQTTPFAMPAQSQSLQNRSSSNAKSYMKRKSDPNLYQASKQDDHFQMQDLQVLQQQTSLDSTTQRITDGESDAQGATYKVSKVDNPYSQSVIRSNSRLEEQVVGLTLHRLKKDERMISSVSQLTQQIGHISNVTHDVKKGANLMQTTQVNVDAKELNQQHSLLHKVHEVKASEQQGQIVSTPPHLHTQAIRHGHQLCLSGAQVLLESACDLQMLQPSILQSGLGTTKISPQVQAIQSPQQVTHQFLQVDSHMAQSNGRHSQQQLHPQSAEIISEPTKPLQQHFTSKDHFVQPNHEPKNQFVSLSTVCFPESMLLNDDRNILSNVDDILAATAAACGVTPTEFAKVSPNEEEIQSIESGDNSKSQFQTVDARHVTPNFSSTPTVVGKPLSINNISLNGGQVTLSLTAVSTMQPNNLSLDQQHIETPDQSIPTRLATSELEQRPEQVSGLVKHQSSNSNDSEGKNLDSTLNVKDSELVSSGRTLNKERVISNNNFNIESDNTVIGNSTKIPFQPILSMQQPGDENGSKTQEERQDILQEDLQRQKDKGHSKTRCVNEDDTNPKQQKRTGQCRPQNSRGADASLQYSSPVAESCYETYQHQEKMRQKIKEVEEKQPEVKTGFIGSFLDFLKSGARQQFSAPAIRMPNRMRRPVAPVIRAPCTHFLSKPQMAAHSASLENGCENSNKKGNKEPKRNSEALPSFSSDEDSVGANQDLQKSITSALSTLDDTSEKKKKIEMETTVSSSMTNTVIKKESSQIAPSVAHAPMKTCFVQPEEEGVESGQLAKPQVAAAIEGCTEEENGESGGEGMYRDRDEFVVKIEDIDALQVTLKTGREPPAIWKVQKALLQKFVPEVRNGQREFTATNSYLGYFGDAKSKYKRVYVKILENSNKKECVRICSKRPRNKPLQSPRPSTSISKVPDTAAPKPATVTTKVSSLKPKAKQPKTKAEPPPKKRKTWKEEFPSSPQRQSDEDDTASTTPFVARFLNTRAMKETFRSYMELLVSMALDPDTMQALEKSNDELLLPHMRKIDSMLNENRKRLLSKLHLERSFKAALESFPELTVIHRDSKTKSGMSAVSRIKMNGKAYNKKTLKISKATTKLAQEFAVDPEKIPLCSLYHSLHHYKYHMFLRCKVEISSVQKKNADLGQEEIVQYCMKNMKWVEDLFEKFGELLNHVQQKCS